MHGKVLELLDSETNPQHPRFMSKTHHLGRAGMTTISLHLKAGRKIKLNVEKDGIKPMGVRQSVAIEELDQIGLNEVIDVLLIGLKEAIDVDPTGLKEAIDAVPIGPREEIDVVRINLNAGEMIGRNGSLILITSKCSILPL